MRAFRSAFFFLKQTTYLWCISRARILAESYIFWSPLALPLWSSVGTVFSFGAQLHLKARKRAKQVKGIDVRGSWITFMPAIFGLHSVYCHINATTFELQSQCHDALSCRYQFRYGGRQRAASPLEGPQKVLCFPHALQTSMLGPLMVLNWLPDYLSLCVRVQMERRPIRTIGHTLSALRTSSLLQPCVDKQLRRQMEFSSGLVRQRVQYEHSLKINESRLQQSGVFVVRGC